MAVRLIALPALNYGNADAIGTAIHASQAAGGTGWWGAVAITVILFGGLIVAALRRRDAAIWPALSGLAIGAASFGFGMVIIDRADLFRVGAGERYNFLPLVLLGLALVAMAMQRTRAWRVYASLCLLMLLTGAVRYLTPLPQFDRGPSWPAEVAAWRRDHRHPLAVWPAPWTADLSDAPRPCASPGRDPARSADPRYCDSGWAAGLLREQQARRRSSH